MDYEENLTQALVEELLETIFKYEESITVATALGCLEIVKAELMLNHLDGLQEDDEE